MAHQARLGHSEESDSVAIKSCQIGAQCQCGPYQTCGHLHYATPVSDSQPASNSRAGGFSAPEYHNYFRFDDSGPFSTEHSPPSELYRLAKTDYPYDPRLFDVGAQFFPAVSPTPATTTVATTKTPPDGLNLTPYHASFAWQYPESNVRSQLEVPVSMVHSTPHLGSMPTAPEMSNFEPMMTTCDIQRAPPSAIQAATPLASPGLSSVANHSPASSVMPTFSRKSSYNSYGGHGPQESIHMLSNSQLNLRFEHVSAPGTSPGDPLVPSTSTSEASHSQVSTNKKRKSERNTTTKKAALKTNSTSSKKTVPKTNAMAATKCRAKTKLVEAELEATERTMSAQNSELSAQVMDLREQVYALKNELLRHGHCDCEIIQRYLTNEAIKIGGGSGVVPSTARGHQHFRKK